MKNQIRELTPEYMRCTSMACPRIYEEVTPKDMQCTSMACPEIHEGNDNDLIIGKRVNPKEFGLEKKVGKGEVLIRVPKALIDKREK